MRRLVIVAVATLVLLAAAPALAQGTARAFEPPSTVQQMLFHGGVGAYVVAGIHDGRQTKLNLDTNPGLVEGNALPAWIINEFGTTTFQAWKIGMTFAIAAGLEWVWHTWDSPTGRWVLIATTLGIAVLQGVVIESNLQVSVLGTSFLF